MHAAPLTSPRLRKLLAVLRDGRAYSTRSLIRKSGVCAINSCVAELRQHGAEIACDVRIIRGERRFYYTMTKEPPDA